MPPMFFVPLSNGGVLVHVLDYVAPANTRVVSTEANFAFLCSAGNNAHLSAAKVVVKQILKPHARDKQEVPTIGAAFFDVLRTAIAANLSVIFSSQPERLVELLEEFIKVELRRGHLRLVMFEKRKTHHDIRSPLPSSGVRYLPHILDETGNVEECRYRAHLLRFLVNHNCRADATVRVATAGDLTPF